MRSARSRKIAHVVIGGMLLAAFSLFGSSAFTRSQTGLLTARTESGGGTFHNASVFGSAAQQARKEWRVLRWTLRNQSETVAIENTEQEKRADAITLRNTRLTTNHLDVSYALPEAECVSLWTTAAANQHFRRVNVIGGFPCSLNAGANAVRLLVSSIQPAVSEGQLMKICTNTRQECSQPIEVSAAAGHAAASDGAITIHSATLSRNAYLAITYTKGEGCVDLVRWNAPGDRQRVSFENDAFTCDAVDHGNARVNIRGMQPLLGPTQWIYLCAQGDTSDCSNVYQIR